MMSLRDSYYRVQAEYIIFLLLLHGNGNQVYQAGHLCHVTIVPAKCKRLSGDHRIKISMKEDKLTTRRGRVRKEALLLTLLA